MKVEGMFQRYKGQIGKYKKITELDRHPSFTNNYLRENEKILLNNAKFSHNIIDLIEVGDYVNGEKVGYIDDCDGAMREYYYDYENASIDVGHLFEEIKSIVTHEQMEQMAYKVEE